MKQPRRWRSGVMASAVALLAGVACLPAHALSLGKISVLSALGEPLRAEIDVAQITSDEASSLKAAVATPEAFKAAGLEYTPVLAGLQVTLQRRADGRSYLRLTSSRPVSEPFVDLVLQATWSAGKLTRDYTMLFDPPGLRPSATAAAPTAPALSRPAAPAASIAAPITREPVARPSAPATSIRPEAAATVKAPAARPAPAESVAGNKQLTVKPGDTAGKIAALNKPGVVSLDQMLVAMLRSNPDAFINGNVNRLKAGAVLDMPGADAAGAISASEANQTIVAQSKDFNAFRRKLAEGVATTPVGNADRQAGGKVQAKVEDRAPAVGTPDKLTLSKGAVQAKAAAAAEDAIAKSRQASDASARVAELSKNISDLNKLGAAPGAAASPPGFTPVSPSTSSTAALAGVGTSPAPGIAVPTPSVIAPSVKPPAPVPAPPPAATPALAASAATAPPKASAAAPALSASSAANPAAAASTAMASATTPAANDAAAATLAAATALAAAPAASQPADSASAATAPAAVVVQKPVVPAAAPPETRLLDDLMKNPLVLPLAAGLLALLAGLGIYSYRKKNASAQVDSSFLESRLQPDSFFGASGGQRIDTNEASPTGSSLVYSPSQLDAAGDVDPVAEADVYLAYGRDLQAEEILKEALRTNPARVAIHAKLAEIHAKRRDNKAFEAIALEAFNLTQGNGPEWAHITEMGRELEPSNSLYQPGGEPAGGHRGNNPVASSAAAMASPKPPVAPASATALAAVLAASSAVTVPPAPVPAPAVDVDVDLDLDFPLGGMQDGHTSPAPIAALVTAEPDRAPVLDKLDMDFSDISSKPIALTYPVPISKAADAGRASEAQANGGAAAPAAVLPDSGMLEFDLDSLSLDLNGPNSRSPAHDPAEEDPLHTKFLLAEEFRSLGDPDGARSLAEEVLAEAQGPLKVKAQAFLNALA